MALYIKGPDSVGTCCECSQRATPCDTCVPNPCSCALLIPPFTTPYANLAEAQLAMTNLVGNCAAYFDAASDNPPNSITADVSVANRLTIAASASHNSEQVWASIYMCAAGTLTITWSGTLASIPAGQTAEAMLYECSGTEIDSDNQAGTSGTMTLTAPTAGEYYIRLSFGGLATTPMHVSATFQIASNVTMTANPVTAQYGDATTPSRLQCSEPTCEMECISETLSELCPPGSGTSCSTSYNQSTPCGATSTTSQIRLILSNLIPGLTYRAIASFSCSGCSSTVCGSGGSILWSFIATSASETTSYESICLVIADGCGCTATSCSVSHVCLCV